MSDTPAPQPILLDVMLDLETMGNGPDAAIMAIGAVLFDPIHGTKGANYYAVIDLQSSVNTGGVIDASTVMWWLAQTADARLALVEADTTLHLSAALADFADWIDIHSDRRRVRMWGNGAAFDNVILASAYRRAGIPQPWRYSNDRCYRTIKAEHPDVPLQREGTHHNAIDDARSQAQHLIDMWAAKSAPVAPPFYTRTPFGVTVGECIDDAITWVVKERERLHAPDCSVHEPSARCTCGVYGLMNNLRAARNTLEGMAAPVAPAAFTPSAECDSPRICNTAKVCAGLFGTKRQCGSPVAPADGLTS